MNNVLPNFFMVGAMKAGTTSLYSHLNNHPQIYMSPIKEPNYFSTDIKYDQFKPIYRIQQSDLDNYLQGSMTEERHIAYIDNWEKYLKLYKNVTTETLIGEASTSYLYSKEAPLNIRKRVPNAKILIVLRNPIERAYSHYCMDVGIGVTKDSFIDAIKKNKALKEKCWGRNSLYVEVGFYYEQVKRYLDLFPAENVKILLLDDMKNSFDQTFLDIANFLDIEPFSKMLKPQNESQWPRFVGVNYLLHNLYIKDLVRKVVPPSMLERGKDIYYGRSLIPSLSTTDMCYLNDLFKEDIQRLSGLIKRDLSHWTTSRH